MNESRKASNFPTVLELTYSSRCAVPLGDTFYGQNTILRRVMAAETSGPSFSDNHRRGSVMYFAALSNDLNNPSGSALAVVHSCRPPLHRKNCIVYNCDLRTKRRSGEFGCVKFLRRSNAAQSSVLHSRRSTDHVTTLCMATYTNMHAFVGTHVKPQTFINTFRPLFY